MHFQYISFHVMAGRADTLFAWITVCHEKRKSLMNTLETLQERGIVNTLSDPALGDLFEKEMGS